MLCPACNKDSLRQRQTTVRRKIGSKLIVTSAIHGHCTSCGASWRFDASPSIPANVAILAERELRKKHPGKHIRELVDGALVQRFQGTLKSLGYKGSGHTWRLNEPKRIKVLNVQMSRFGSAMAGSLTINLGVYDYLLERIIRPNKKLLNRPLEYQCSIRTRIGRLMKLPKPQVDYWWAYDIEDDPKKLDGELTKVLREFGLPWLNKASHYSFLLNHPEFVYGRQSPVYAALELVAPSADDFATGELKALLEEGEDSFRREGTVDGDEAFNARRARRAGRK